MFHHKQRLPVQPVEKSRSAYVTHHDSERGKTVQKGVFEEGGEKQRPTMNLEKEWHEDRCGAEQRSGMGGIVWVGVWCFGVF
jgi:hypothetical protein